jgi:competence ComEA-like helix-hairpin-helix protein
MAEFAISHWEMKNVSKNTDVSLQKKYALLHRQLDSLQQQEAQFFKQETFEKPQEQKTFSSPKVKNSNISIDINQANATDWKAVPGIGNVLSERIVKYREKLGGFVSISQLKEVYGISDSVFQVIQPHLKKKKYISKTLNINKSELEIFNAHPYFKNRWGKQIVNYRTKVKPFSTLEDFRNLYGMNDSVYNKLLPYITIQ